VLTGQATEMSWGAEKPARTPFSEHAQHQGWKRSGLKDEWEGTKFNRKTVDSLWIGGPQQPELETLKRGLSELRLDCSTHLPGMRRWYGLRAVAYLMAELWGWDVLGGWITWLVEHAREIHRSLETSGLGKGDSALLARAGLWEGWDLAVCRWFFDQRSAHPADAGYGADFRSLASGGVAQRIQELAQLASGGPAVERRLIEKGHSPAEARQWAVSLVLCGPQAVADNPIGAELEGLQQALNAEDWQKAETHARRLVEVNPGYSDNHMRLAQALLMQRRWEHALAAVKAGRSADPDDGRFAILEVEIELDRASHRRDGAGFSRALELLDVIAAPGTHWNLDLLRADAHFALGQWSDAREACKAVVGQKAGCGEAYALGSMCHRMLGNERGHSDWSRMAKQRGAEPLLRILQDREREGVLGSREIAPIPRWHRFDGE